MWLGPDLATLEKPGRMGFIYMYEFVPRCSGVPRGGFGGFNPPPEIPKALQNRAKINPIVKTVKNC